MPLPATRKLWPSAVAAIALFALLMSLGFWQLDRAGQKRDRAQMFSERRDAPPVDLANAARPDADALLWRRVRATGRYLEPAFILDNRTRAGRVGFEVLSPFTLDDGTHVLVDRGFIPAAPDRSQVPTVATPLEPATVTGYAGPAPVTGLRLGAAADAIENLNAGLRRIQHVDFAQLAAALGRPLQPYVVYLDESAAHGFDRRFEPPGDGSSRHTAYATQWFTMAGVLVIILGTLLLRRRQGAAG